ncbi:MAG: hypothetical protein WCP31_08055, partial [Chloroflexales bacterium]
LRPDQPQIAQLREGWVIRRRKGRGPGAHALLWRGTLQPLSEDDALRHGFAQVALVGTAPITVQRTEEVYLLPDLPLPDAHRVVLGRFSDRRFAEPRIASADMPLVAALLARLGLTLQHAS